MMDVLIKLTVKIISPCVSISNHHIVNVYNYIFQLLLIKAGKIKYDFKKRYSARIRVYS